MANPSIGKQLLLLLGGIFIVIILIILFVKLIDGSVDSKKRKNTLMVHEADQLLRGTSNREINGVLHEDAGVSGKIIITPGQEERVIKASRTHSAQPNSILPAAAITSQLVPIEEEEEPKEEVDEQEPGRSERKSRRRERRGRGKKSNRRGG